MGQSPSRLDFNLDSGHNLLAEEKPPTVILIYPIGFKTIGSEMTMIATMMASFLISVFMYLGEIYM